MTNVNRPVSIGQSRCNQVAFETFHGVSSVFWLKNDFFDKKISLSKAFVDLLLQTVK